MKKQDELGVLIDTGAQDWQVFQRSGDGTASIGLSGRWLTSEPHKQARVCVRVVRETDGEAVARGLDWVRATTRKDGTWRLRQQVE